MFNFFDHTADLGIHVEGATLNTLFAEAGRALTAAMVDDPTTIRPIQLETIEIAGTDITYLLFDWLNELLYRFEGRRILYCTFDVGVSDHGLTGTIAGEPIDPTRHPLGHEVKAITYHGLSLEEQDGTWVAEVIVDI